jgi:hypothetical protein
MLTGREAAWNALCATHSTPRRSISRYENLEENTALANEHCSGTAEYTLAQSLSIAANAGDHSIGKIHSFAMKSCTSVASLLALRLCHQYRTGDRVNSHPKPLLETCQ